MSSMSTKSTTVMKPVLLAALFCSLLLMPGCSDSNVLSNGNFAFTFELLTTNEGATDYECVVLDLTNFLVTPLDAGASEFLGSDGLNLANGISEISFKPTTCTSRPAVPLPPILLASGEYVVSQLRMTNFQLIEEVGGAGDTGCFTPVDPIEEGIFLEPLTISVGADQANTVTISLDVSALETGINNTAFPGFGICDGVVEDFNDIFEFR